MCRVLDSCAVFKAILTPFSEVVKTRRFSFYKNGEADHSIDRWLDVTLQIALSLFKRKSPESQANRWFTHGGYVVLHSSSRIHGYSG